MIYLIASLSLATTGLVGDITADPTFKKMSDLVGGKWVGSLGKLKVEFVYKFLENGKMIEGVGHLTQDGKPIANMDSKFGWDPAVKKVYYLDCHGNDTVYNGHVILKNGKFEFDFVGLIGDKGHYLSYASMPTPDRYEFEMYQYKDGKLAPTHIGVKFHRVK